VLFETPDLVCFFRSHVEGAQEELEVDLVPEAEHYVVVLLVRTAENADEAPLDRPLVLQWKDAIEEPNLAKRFLRFRGMGDSALLRGGLFPESHAAQGVTDSYVCGLGRHAYAEAGRAAPTGMRRAGVFDALADSFDDVVRVLLELRERARCDDDIDVARMASAVARHGSPAAARRLAALGLHGVKGEFDA
jgi:hypothetical protein